ncbi:MAG: SulP family inorganic anion transporter [Solirubrobacteraceae bacterium]
MNVLPAWLRGYDRGWLRADVVAGLIVWSVVTPQAVAYAQIAGLPPAAGLIAAPGAMIGYALLGTSRTLVVSATTATSALSAAAVAPLAGGDTAKFAALSAALALVAAALLAGAALLKLGGLTDFVSRPVMTGFLFGLGMLITVGQLPAILGVPAGDGNFFPKLADLLESLGDAHAWTVAVGAASIAGLVALRRLAPALPGTLIVLGLAIALSALLGLEDKGVAVVGALPDAVPDPSVPDVSLAELGQLVPAALGVMIVGAEALGVSRALAAKDGYAIDVNRELYALGGANLLAGLSSGFVQSGGASQTAAAENAGGRTQLATVIAGGLILITGAFLTGLFEPLPQATLAAIVVVAVASFYDVAELRRITSVRRSALGFALIALAGLLLLGVLPGLLIAAVLSLALLLKRLSRPPVQPLGRDPVSGAWGALSRHPAWEVVDDVLVVRVEGFLFYADVNAVRERLVDLVAAAGPRPRVLVLELDQDDVDVESLDVLAELAGALRREDVELRLGGVRSRVRELLGRSGLDASVAAYPTLDGAVAGQ